MIHFDVVAFSKRRSTEVICINKFLLMLSVHVYLYPPNFHYGLSPYISSVESQKGIKGANAVTKSYGISALLVLNWQDIIYIVSWEPEGRYHYSTILFRWEPEGRYCCTKSMVIVPFWFSTEHPSTVLTPFWFSANDM